MRRLAARYPDDADIAVLAAEAIMNAHPYDYWRPGGSPQPWTPEVVALLDRATRLAPDHPGAHHYRIHLYEASTTPDKGARLRRPHRRARAGGRPPRAHAVAHLPASRPLSRCRPGEPGRRRVGPRVPRGGERQSHVRRGLRAAQRPLPVGVGAVERREPGGHAGGGRPGTRRGSVAAGGQPARHAPALPGRAVADAGALPAVGRAARAPAAARVGCSVPRRPGPLRARHGVRRHGRPAKRRAHRPRDCA